VPITDDADMLAGGPGRGALGVLRADANEGCDLSVRQASALRELFGEALKEVATLGAEPLDQAGVGGGELLGSGVDLRARGGIGGSLLRGLLLVALRLRGL
jgi:hypothetical protein